MPAVLPRGAGSHPEGTVRAPVFANEHKHSADHSEWASSCTAMVPKAPVLLGAGGGGGGRPTTEVTVIRGGPFPFLTCRHLSVC